MQTEAIRLSAVIPASPQRIYDAWLDAQIHAAITETAVAIDPVIGGKFSAGNGYIAGETLWLDRGRLIVQSWRTNEFPEDAEDSRLEVHLEAVDGGTRMIIDHRQIPAGQADAYEEGWRNWYLEPMQTWFSAHPEEEMDAANEQAAEPTEDETTYESIEAMHAMPPENVLVKMEAATPDTSTEGKARKPAPKRKTTPRTAAARVATPRKKTARASSAGTRTSGTRRGAATTTTTRRAAAAGAKTTRRASADGTRTGTTRRASANGTKASTTRRASAAATPAKRGGAARTAAAGTTAKTRTATTGKATTVRGKVKAAVRKVGAVAKKATTTARRAASTAKAASTPGRAKAAGASKTTPRSTAPKLERRVAGPAKKTATRRPATAARKPAARRASTRKPRTT